MSNTVHTADMGGARWAPEDFDDMAMRMRQLSDEGHSLADDWANMAEQAARDLRSTNTVKVDQQGVLFGQYYWVSHERITGIEADRLRERREPFAKQYMAWYDSLARATGETP